MLACWHVFVSLAVLMIFRLSAFAAPMPLPDQAYTTGFSDCSEWRVSWSSRRQQLEFQFGDHIARSHEDGGWTSRECNITVPITVPAGYRVAVGYVGLEYDGLIGKGGHGYTALRYGLKDVLVKGESAGFQEGRIHDVILYEPLPQWSNCGEDVEFEVRSYLAIFTPPMTAATVAIRNGVSSIQIEDPGSQLACQLQYQRC